jgi:hypothetical protein
MGGSIPGRPVLGSGALKLAEPLSCTRHEECCPCAMQRKLGSFLDFNQGKLDNNPLILSESHGNGGFDVSRD